MIVATSSGRGGGGLQTVGLEKLLDVIRSLDRAKLSVAETGWTVALTEVGLLVAGDLDHRVT